MYTKGSMYKIIGSDQKTYGPVPADQIRKWIAEGRVTGATLAQEESSTEWKPLSAFPEFALPPGPTIPPAIIPPKPYAAPHETNTMATAGFICGIISLIPCCCFGFIFAILGIVFSAIALGRVNRYPNENGKGLAIAGLICSAIGLGGGLIFTWLYALAPNHGINYNWQHRW